MDIIDYDGKEQLVSMSPSEGADCLEKWLRLAVLEQEYLACEDWELAETIYQKRKPTYHLARFAFMAAMRCEPMRKPQEQMILNLAKELDFDFLGKALDRMHEDSMEALEQEALEREQPL